MKLRDVQATLECQKAAHERKPRFRIVRLEERIAPTHKGVGHGQHQPPPWECTKAYLCGGPDG